MQFNISQKHNIDFNTNRIAKLKTILKTKTLSGCKVLYYSNKGTYYFVKIYVIPTTNGDTNYLPIQENNQS